MIPAITSSLSPELTALLQSLTEKRGSNENWTKMSAAVMARMAACTPDERVWCRGEIHGPNRHYPAILIFSNISNKVHALAASGEDFAIEEHPIQLFWSTIPHIAISREVLDDRNDNGTI